MIGAIGDTVRIHGRTVGAHDRIGKIIEVHGEHGAPPYLVRFEDGHERLIFPGPDCEVQHLQAQQSPRPA